MRLATVCVWLTFAACLDARAQAPDYNWPKSLSSETRIALTKLADSARAANLPADAIVAKAAEGVLKGADDARIVRAARTLLGEMSTARSVLPAHAGFAVLNAATSALHAGVSPATLSGLVAASAGSETDLAIGLVAVADLAASGVVPAEAGSAIAELLKRRAPEADITALRTSVARDIAAGNTPQAALGKRMDGLLRVLETKKER
jgi:hypothetical protein